MLHFACQIITIYLWFKNLLTLFLSKIHASNVFISQTFLKASFHLIGSYISCHPLYSLLNFPIRWNGDDELDTYKPQCINPEMVKTSISIAFITDVETFWKQTMIAMSVSLPVFILFTRIQFFVFCGHIVTVYVWITGFSLSNWNY